MPRHPLGATGSPSPGWTSGGPTGGAAEPPHWMMKTTGLVLWITPGYWKVNILLHMIEATSLLVLMGFLES